MLDGGNVSTFAKVHSSGTLPVIQTLWRRASPCRISSCNLFQSSRVSSGPFIWREILVNVLCSPMWLLYFKSIICLDLTLAQQPTQPAARCLATCHTAMPERQGPATPTSTKRSANYLMYFPSVSFGHVYESTMNQECNSLYMKMYDFRWFSPVPVPVPHTGSGW